MKPFGKNTYCGPAVLSMVFNISTDDAARHVRQITGRKFVKWMSMGEMDLALGGVAVRKHNYAHLGSGRPTLRCVHDAGFKPSGVYVVLITGHFVIVHQGKVYDNGWYHNSDVKCLFRKKVYKFWEIKLDASVK